MQEIIDRINELYHKSQNEGLTEEEKARFLGLNAQQFYGFTDLVELPYIKNMSE